MPTLTRPMFSEQAQNGGIVSTVSPVQETAPVPQGVPDLQGQVNATVAEEVAATNMEIDSAETIDDMLAAMGGTATSTEAARTELAAVVGEQDANSTPESVLPLTQTTLQLIAAVESTNGQGGLGNLLGAPGELMASTMGDPMGDPTNPLAAPTMDVPVEGFQPTVGFALGGLNASSPFGTPPIYDPRNNPLITNVPSVTPTVAAGNTPMGDSSGLPSYRGDLYAPAPAPIPGRVSNLWNIPSATAEKVDLDRVKEIQESYQGLLEKSLPKIDTVDERVSRRTGQLEEYIPEKRTAEDLLSEQKELMGEYLTKTPAHEEVLAEFREDYGDVQKDLETHGWLQLAKFGARIATSNKSPFYAIGKALPELADGLNEAAKEKATIDRRLKTEARSEFKRLQDLRNQQELALAQGSFDMARTLGSEHDEIQRTLRTAAITSFEQESSERSRMLVDMASGNLNYAQILARDEVNAVNVNARHKDELIAGYAQEPPEYFLMENKETGEWEPTAGRLLPYGLFDLKGNYVHDANIVPITASSYAQRMGTGLMDPQSKTVVLFGPEYGAQGFGQFGGTYDANSGRWFANIGPDGGPVPLDENYQWMPGTVDDVVTVTSDPSGKVRVTNKLTGDTMFTRAVRADGSLIEFTPPKDLEVDATHPYAVPNEAPAVPWERLAANVQDELIVELMDSESAIRELEQLIPRIAGLTGPQAGFRRMGNRIAAVLPPGAWDDFFTNVTVDDTQWRLVVETLVRAQVPSTRYPAAQVDYVREELGEMPSFFANSAVATEKFKELTRRVLNSYAHGIGQLNGTPYSTMERIPTGRKEEAFDFSDPAARGYIRRVMTTMDPRAQDELLRDKWVFYPVPEGQDDVVRERLNERDANGNLIYGIQWQTPQPAQNDKPRGIWSQYK